jgi:hypothetical protein
MTMSAVWVLICFYSARAKIAAIDFEGTFSVRCDIKQAA